MGNSLRKSVSKQLALPRNEYDDINDPPQFCSYNKENQIENESVTEAYNDISQ